MSLNRSLYRHINWRMLHRSWLSITGIYTLDKTKSLPNLHSTYLSKLHSHQPFIMPHMWSFFNISGWGMHMRHKLHWHLHGDQHINSGNVEQRGKFTHILQNSMLVTFGMCGKLMHKRDLLHSVCQWIRIGDHQCPRTILRRLSFIDRKLHNLLNTHSMHSMRSWILHNCDIHM